MSVGFNRCRRRAPRHYAHLLNDRIYEGHNAIDRLCAFDRYYAFALAFQCALWIATDLTVLGPLQKLFFSHHPDSSNALMDLVFHLRDFLGGAYANEAGTIGLGLGQKVGYAWLASRLSRSAWLQPMRTYLLETARVAYVDTVEVAHALRSQFAIPVDRLLASLPVASTGGGTGPLVEEARIVEHMHDAMLEGTPVPVEWEALAIPVLQAQARRRLGANEPLPRTRRGLLALLKAPLASTPPGAPSPMPQGARDLPLVMFTRPTLQRILREWGEPVPNVPKPQLVELVQAAAVHREIPICWISTSSLSRLSAEQLRHVIAYFAVAADSAATRAVLIQRIQSAVARRCTPARVTGVNPIATA
jgi:hypothetical protein